MELNILKNFSLVFGAVPAASIESLLFFVLIAAASAVFNWIKKRAENAGQGSTPQNLPSRTASPIQRREKKGMNWEEELRRLLEANLPKPPPPAPTIRKTPPLNSPVVLSRAPQSVPTNVHQEKFYKAHCNHCNGHIEFPASAMEEIIYCPHCQQQTVLRPFQETPVETLAHRKNLASLTQSATAHQKASRLDKNGGGHLSDVPRHAVGLTSTQNFKRRSPEINQTLALFRQPRAARQAVIASVIFATPKGLEN
ncbi:MAG: hypothetical protein M3Y82_12610 [Verrucomicrobiota bacterium]|nr:hypothetical protein [Verrucomicrobiota bacterium]